MKSRVGVGIIGFGTVGTGVARILLDNAGLIRRRVGVPVELIRIADLDVARDRGLSLPAGMLTQDSRRVLDDPDVDIVVELIGGYDAAKRRLQAFAAPAPTGAPTLADVRGYWAARTEIITELHAAVAHAAAHEGMLCQAALPATLALAKRLDTLGDSLADASGSVVTTLEAVRGTGTPTANAYAGGELVRLQRARDVAGALVEPAQTALLARLAARERPFLRQPARMRGDRRERQQIVAVVIEHALDRRRVAGAQEVKVARRDLEAGHVAEAMEAEHRSLE